MRIKKAGAALLALCVLLCCLVPAFAAQPEVTDLPGSNVGYLFDAQTGTLKLVLTHGAKSGDICDNPTDGAMFPMADQIKTVELAPWIYGIGDRAFADLPNLENVWLPATVREIGRNAFDGCGTFAVHYDGSQEEWNKVEIAKENEALQAAFMIYGSFETDPGEPDVEPTVEPKPENLCRWCNTVHGDGFFERIVAWFHGVLATLFKR